jgi:hypothetical protein
MAKRTLNIKHLTPRKDSPYQQGYYKLINPEKYIGDPSKIIFRSGWEKKFATYCDINDRVIAWSSEPFKIDYWHPVEKKIKPYNIDFYVKIDKGDRQYSEYIIEVKPSKQLKQPMQPIGRVTVKRMESYTREMKRYLTNLAKFQAAREWAAGRGWEFVVVTESWLFK